MPIERPDDFGTELDGTLNTDYCFSCYQRGQFREPDLQVTDMISRIAGYLTVNLRIPWEESTRLIEGFIPRLKRWQERAAQFKVPRASRA